MFFLDCLTKGFILIFLNLNTGISFQWLAVIQNICEKRITLCKSILLSVSLSVPLLLFTFSLSCFIYWRYHPPAQFTPSWFWTFMKILLHCSTWKSSYFPLLSDWSLEVTFKKIIIIKNITLVIIFFKNIQFINNISDI